MRNPSNQQIADCLGFNESIDQTQVRDLVVIGAGPSGLAAAVYGTLKDSMFWSWKQVFRAVRQVKLKDRKLFGVSHRYLRSRDCGSSLQSGAKIWGGHAHHQGDATCLRPQTVRGCSRERSFCFNTNYRYCNGCGVSKATMQKLVAF